MCVWLLSSETQTNIQSNVQQGKWLDIKAGRGKPKADESLVNFLFEFRETDIHTHTHTNGERKIGQEFDKDSVARSHKQTKIAIAK